jgi:catechol 2,3-dioxygenase-like lactoylglutathione lyase family enzyme
MPGRRKKTPSTATLLGAEPQLFVRDLQVSIDFYREKLGFAVAFTYGEPPFYGQVCRDTARLNLRQLDEPAIEPSLQKRAELLSASITVDDVARLCAEFAAADAPFQQELRTQPWGARTFVIADPDGNLILFAGAA